MSRSPAPSWWQNLWVWRLVVSYYAFIMRGFEDRPPQDKRVVMGYATMFPVIMLITLFLLPFFVSQNMGQRPLAIMVVVAAFSYVLIPFFAKRSLILGDISFLALLSWQSGTRAYLFGAETGFQYNMAFAVYVVFIIIGFQHKWRILAYAVYAAAFISFFHIFFPHPSSNFAHVSPETLNGFRQINILTSALGTILMGLIILRRAENAERALDAEHKRSEKLLQNLLPKEIASRLKRDENKIIADNIKDATVLFADIVAFTPRASRMPADQLVTLLNQIFQEFDTLTSRHGLEKIKTIGDSYMVVGGLPASSPKHAKAMAHLASEMMQVISTILDDRGEQISLRIGIHSGPVVAGVIGKSKVFYDVWGETVNVASRLENNAGTNQILVSKDVAQQLEGAFITQQCGSKMLHGIGVFETYQVTNKI